MLQVQEFFDKATSTLTYVVWDTQSKDAVVIDPVLDYDPASSKTSTQTLQSLFQYLRDQSLLVHFILETHAHADHISGAQPLKREYPSAKIGIGKHILEVQTTFKDVFGLASLKTDGSQFDVLFEDEQRVKAGALEFRVIFTSGHTPACVSYLFGEEFVFTGDAIFMPDSGTGRCDFPGGSAEALYHSIHERLYRLPETVKMHVGHDYQPQGRSLKFVTTIAEQKLTNTHIRAETSKEEFVSMRSARDKTLGAPKLLLPALQLNINAGQLPVAEPSGRRFLKIPIT